MELQVSVSRRNATNAVGGSEELSTPDPASGLRRGTTRRMAPALQHVAVWLLVSNQEDRR